MKTSRTLLRRLSAGIVAAAATTSFLAAHSSTVQAATTTPTPTAHSTMMKMAHGKAVYVCAKCKEYCTPAQAKAMKYTDPMGHHLTMMSKVPAGYTMGGKSAMMSSKSKM